MFFVSSCGYLYWSQVLSQEWRCGWSSADRRCSNYIWVINSLIAYKGASYIRDLMVFIWCLNHQPHDCLLNCLFSRRSKKTSKLRVIGLCEGNSQVTGEFPAQRASNMENVSIWWSWIDTPGVPVRVTLCEFRIWSVYYIGHYIAGSDIMLYLTVS